MKLPITDLMDDCCPEQAAISQEIHTQQIKDNVLNRIHAEPKPICHFRPSVLLVAALIMTLLVGTAVATGNAISAEPVDDPSVADRIVVHYDAEGNVTDAQVIEMPDAQFAVTYEVEQPQYHRIQYKVNWLPYPAHDTWPKVMDTSGWLDNYTDAYIQNDGYYTTEGRPYKQLDVMLYQIRVTGMTGSGDIHYYNGEPTFVKQDTWNGWSRLEFTIDYTNSTTVYWGRPINYLILFDPETSVHVQIAGTMDFETYEKIAEHMEIKVCDELHPMYTEEWQEWIAEYQLPFDIVGKAVFADLGVG